MRKRLLLISNSTNYGSDYLDHCQGRIVSFLGNDTKTILFLPYAKPDMDAYAKKAKKRFEKMGYNLVSIHEMGDPIEENELPRSKLTRYPV